MEHRDPNALETRELPSGTVIHVNGCPLVLVNDAAAATHPDNWGLISEPQPAVIGQTVMG